MKKFLKSTKAVAAIEFAIIAPVFFLLLIGIIEIGLTMFMQSSLDTGIRVYARNGMTQSQTYDQLVATMSNNTGGIFNPKKMSLLIYNTAAPCAGSTSNNNFANLLCIQKGFFANPDGAFDNNSKSGGTFDNRNPPATTTYAASNTILLYGIRYDWGGITGLMSPFIPKELYSFTVVRNESY